MNKTTFISCALIIILGFVVYSNSIDGKFIWDDANRIKNNIYIRDWSNLPKIFTRIAQREGGEGVVYFRPLGILINMIDYSLFGLNVRGYHLTNILFHILVALSIYWFVNILYDDRLLSLFTSLLFIVHPIHTETVAYISNQPNYLVTLFMLLCFIFYVKRLHLQGIKTYLLIILSYILALLSKENALILPVLLLLYHYIFKKEIKIKEFLPFLSIIFIYILFRLPTLTHNSQSGTPFQRTPGFFVAIINYIKLLLLPFNLHMEYGNRLFNFSDFKVITGAVILSFLLIYAFKIRTSNKIVSFSVFWFFITLLPVSNIYPTGTYMAERYLYLPSIGFFMILAKLLSRLYRTKNLKVFTSVFVISLTAFYSYLTIRQNDYWKEPITFYERTLRYIKNSPRVYNNLGTVYRRTGKKEQAIASYKKAIEINPNYARAYNNLGNTYYYDIGKKEQAIASYKKAIEINPNYAKTYYNLGNLYYDIGKKEQAIASYKKAIEINSTCAESYNNLSIVYCHKKEYKIAIKYCDKATELGFNNPVLLKTLKSYRR